MDSKTEMRAGEYAVRGDYHREIDRNWQYYPNYLAKMAFVRRRLERLPAGADVLDAGCGEGVLVEEYASRYAMVGIDSSYSSERVRRGSLTALPFADRSFDMVLCLDVLEHLPYVDQPVALGELGRVMRDDGKLVVSVPNLAHLESRIRFLLRGRLVRTASAHKHPGDRSIAEYLELFRRTGFRVAEHRGVFPTVPLVARAIRRYPARLVPLHRLLTRVLPVRGWCFLNLLTLRKDARA